MDPIEFERIWKSYDQKMEDMLAINTELAIDLTRQKLRRQMNRLVVPKWTAIGIGVPYALLLIAITTIAAKAKAYFVAIGFGAIALVTIALLLGYCYQLYLIDRVKNDEDVLSTQKQLSNLRLSSFNCIKLGVLQLPFWSVCWVSLDAIKDNPFVYGGIHGLIFLLLAYMAYWLYHKVSVKNKVSKVRDFFLSGNEWEPILKAAALLEQLKEYEK